MHEIAKIMTDSEFRELKENIRDKVDAWKEDGLGYVSRKCQLMMDICDMDDRQVFTVEQLRELFELTRE